MGTLISTLLKQVGDISVDNLMGKMPLSSCNWGTFEGFISRVMKKKEEIEKIRLAKSTQLDDVISDIDNT